MDDNKVMWCSTYGAYFALQVWQCQRDGRDPTAPETLDRFAEEARTVADLAIVAEKRHRREEEKRNRGHEWSAKCDDPCCEGGP